MTLHHPTASTSTATSTSTQSINPHISISLPTPQINCTNLNHSLNNLSSSLSSSISSVAASISIHQPIIKSRQKVNTLPPWAKSFEDDDQLFQSKPNHTHQVNHSSSSTNQLASSSLSHSNSSSSSSSVFTFTHQPKTIPFKSQSSLDLSSSITHHSSTHPFTGQKLIKSKSESLFAPQSQDLSNHALNSVENGQLESDNPLDNSNNVKPSTRRSLYRAMTTPSSPVFQRFKPLILHSVSKLRQTDQENTQTHNDDDTNPQETSSLNDLNQPRQPPDDRWWQFTLPTKYRKKVEEYIARSGRAIGGVDHGFHQDSSKTQTNHDFNQKQKNVNDQNMVEIDEYRKKILDLLKQNSLQRLSNPDLVSEPDHIHRQNYLPLDFPKPSYHPISPSSTYLKRSSNDDQFTTNENNPADFPLSAFSRKLSLTYPSSQQQQESSSNKLFRSRVLLPKSERRDDPNSNTNPHYYHHHHHRLPSSELLVGHHQYSEQSSSSAFRSFLIYHPIAPLVFRLINIILTTISLGLSIGIQRIENEAKTANNLSNNPMQITGSTRLLGNSTLFILTIAPLSLIHNLFAIYCEYFGAPIGIWSVSWKMFHTLSELVFISLWSSGVTLTMNDELSSKLKCFKNYDYFSKFISDNSENNQALVNGKLQFNVWNELCSLQASLVSISFIGLVLNVLVLVVSLLRIFIKVSRKY
ncbi:hypothetical protein O181_073441 [Austropuccinia psidii MF-1]|uniref:Uncharacterized protein n=1 Tax=Austropuccinia psidii MF-1 TaxID=1389203 RepID=A0A9Q3I8A3_9BASI|nr:hypothetical protein [Austropuccinia psidii MF-1]